MSIKAIRIHEHGGPQVLRWEDVDIGAPGPDQVLIRHTAVGLNFRDILVRKGQHAVDRFPAGLGIEGAGVVEAVGPDVADLTPGQRVVAASGPDGAYVEARILPAARVIPLPDDIDDQVAAAMMVRGMTARALLKRAYPVQAGDTILVHAAAGALGMILSRWAKHLGATVIGTASTAEKAALAAENGCDHTLVYTEDDVAARVREITNGAGVPVVYDSIGRDTFEGSLASLRPMGYMLSYGEASGDPPAVEPRRLGALGSIFLSHPRLRDYVETRDDMIASANDLFDAVRQGVVKIEIGQTYALKDAAQAQADVEARKTQGSTVLLP